MADLVTESGDGKLRFTLIEGDESIRTAPFECVLDIDAFGALIGIEILGFQDQLGVAPPVHHDGVPTWSYDHEVDVFYLRLRRARSKVQPKKTGIASFGEKGSVVSLEVLL
jgi:uncharacterized protein YuzE